MRGVHSAVDDIRRSVFTEVARLAYESDDYKQVDMIPYKIVPGEVAHHRHDVFLERAIVSARLKLALGMDLDPNGPSAPISANIQDAATDQKYFNEPLVNIIPYACNACPPKQVRITDSCQGCISHPCMNVCPKDAIYLDENKRCHIDQSKCIKCGKCFNQCPYRAISKVERPCAAACGMDAIESDELGRAKINYDKCVSCGMCLVNCPFAAIADKSQIFQLIQAIKRGEEVIACVAPAFVGQYGPDATPAKLKAAMRILGFADVVEVAIGADLCTVEEAHDFLEEVPEKLDWMGTSCCPAWSMMAKKLFPQFKDNISMALTPMVITARMVKKDHPDARIVLHRALRRQEAGGQPEVRPFRRGLRADLRGAAWACLTPRRSTSRPLRQTLPTAWTRAAALAAASPWAAAWLPLWWKPSSTLTRIVRSSLSTATV